MFDAVGVATVSAKPCIVLFIVLDDEGGCHIALWNRVWVDLIFYTNVEDGVLLVRKPLAA